MWFWCWFYETGSLYVSQVSAEHNLPALASQGLRGQLCATIPRKTSSHMLGKCLQGYLYPKQFYILFYSFFFLSETGSHFEALELTM